MSHKAKPATTLIFLVAKKKNLVTNATISVAVSSPDMYQPFHLKKLVNFVFLCEFFKTVL